MSKRSKSLRAADAKIDREQLYAPLEAVRLAKETSTTKFDGTVEVAFRLGVDPRKADQMVRGTVNLPHGTGKTARVLVFATGDRAEAARGRGRRHRRLRRTDRRGGEGPSGLRRRRRHPGPHGQGRPPRPRARPAWSDAEPEDRHRHPRRGQGRHRDQGRQDRVPRRQALEPALHHRQGVLRRRPSWWRTTRAALEEILRLKPSAAKGRYIKKAAISTTMGPGIPVDPNRTRNLLVEEDPAAV